MNELKNLRGSNSMEQPIDLDPSGLDCFLTIYSYAALTVLGAKIMFEQLDFWDLSNPMNPLYVNGVVPADAFLYYGMFTLPFFLYFRNAYFIMHCSTFIDNFFLQWSYTVTCITAWKDFSEDKFYLSLFF